ncbi:MAG: cytochrome c oxidase subunit II [Polyangiaceae bacterium]|nr:cytochrome c oxidase subunit II [Polyangiaceae bacterium]
MNELMRRLLYLPPQGSTVAREIDMLHFAVISVTMIGATAVALLAGFWMIKYRRGRRAPNGHRAHPGERSLVAEIIMLGGLVALFLGFWVIGFRQYVKMRVPPADSIEVYVTAKQWMWTFAYADGTRSNGVLYVPANRPVKLIMSSRDVIHSFYVPEFRIKQDVVPGRMTTVWFEAAQPGTYRIMCAEYCGANHSTMRGTVVALSPADYERHLTPSPSPIAGPRISDPAVAGATPEAPLSLADEGGRVAADHGCLRCHTEDGTPHIGPTWAGLYGTTIDLDSGERIVVDEAYLTESMMEPAVRIHRGYRAVMPSYAGLLDAPEVGALVARIKELRSVPIKPDPPPVDPVLEVVP